MKPLSCKVVLAAVACTLNVNVPLVRSFVIHPMTITRTVLSPPSRIAYTSLAFAPCSHESKQTPTTTTELQMSFLPPSNDRGTAFGPLASSLLTVGLTVAFFLSPIGSFVLGLFNSLLLLSILLPVLGVAAFNAWQYFNTITGPCPSCGATVTVAKRQSGEFSASPSLCLNCGAVIRASDSNEEIDLEGGQDMTSSQGFFDSFFSTPSIGVTPQEKSDAGKRARREQTVIDVEVED